MLSSVRKVHSIWRQLYQYKVCHQARSQPGARMANLPYYLRKIMLMIEKNTVCLKQIDIRYQVLIITAAENFVELQSLYIYRLFVSSTSQLLKVI